MCYATLMWMKLPKLLLHNLQKNLGKTLYSLGQTSYKSAIAGRHDFYDVSQTEEYETV